MSPDDRAKRRQDALFRFVEAPFPASQIAQVELQRGDQNSLVVKEGGRIG